MDTSTAQWTLVVQRVSQTTVEVWVGTLFPSLEKPHDAQVILFDSQQNVLATQSIKHADWERPFRNHSRRFYFVARFDQLSPSCDYQLAFQRLTKTPNEHWQTLKEGQFSTLPDQLSTDANTPFTVALGSCFYEHRDGGQVAASYKALYKRAAYKHKPDITLLTGDQVYLDIGFDSLSLIPAEIRERIADDYAKHWQALGSIFTRGATWMMPDDHEFWNDYPNYKTNIPTLQALRLEKVRTAWTRASKDAVHNIQRTKPMEFINIGNDISFCLADMRTNRKENRFLPETEFQQLLQWVLALQGPAVLVIPQPLIVGENSQEKNLRSYKKQYKALLQAMSKCQHDIVVLSGDVHFGRISSVSLGGNGNKLVEIISSPMSNLTGLNGIATATPQATPEYFPPSDLNIAGLAPSKVSYDKSHMVSTKKGWLFSSYPKARTTEHFMTVSFSKQPDASVKMSVEAWRVRERQGSKYLPKKDFDQPYVSYLK